MFKCREPLVAAIENGFDNKPVLVVGDLILDRYLWGEVNRISPEAPIPVVRLRRQTEAGGGAANVALNLASLGLKVHLAGFVGDDPEAQSLCRLVREQGVSTDAVIAVTGRPTTTKTRVVGAHQQMLRLDSEDVSDFPVSALTSLHKATLEVLDGVAAVVLSDYVKGALPEQTCRLLVAEAHKHRIPVFVDSKAASFTKFQGATAITPNLSELANVVAIPVGRLDDLIRAAEALRQQLSLEFIVLTRGEKGMTLLDSNGAHHFPARARDVFDVSGAGDTVMALLTAGLLADLDLADVLHLANLGAGIVVSRLGTSAVHSTELLQAIDLQQRTAAANKVHSLVTLQPLIEEWRARGEKIVFTNGCFDLLHVGHISYLEEAKRCGDKLIVGLNTDRSVQALKGPERPLVCQEDRAKILAALSTVDAIVLFDSDTPLQLIEALEPDVLVKGADYTEEQVVGAKEVRAWGGDVVLVPRVAGQSTSELVERAQLLLSAKGSG